MELTKLLESLLFYKSEPVSVSWLAEASKRSVEEVSEALVALENILASRGIVLLKNEDEVILGTHPEAAAAIETITKEELSGEIGKAGMETLSIILYKGPISRTAVDYIRGVNSQFTLRHLLMRGLIRRRQNPDDARTFLYEPTVELLAYMGMRNKEDLPNYEEVRIRLEQVENRLIEENETKDNTGNP